MIEVAAAIIFGKSKVLIARRASHKVLAGFWEFPGGKIESGETTADCLKRELQEELDIQITVGDFLTEHIHDYGAFQILLKGYLCAYVSGTFKLSDHDEVKWIDPKDILESELAPADVPLLRKLIEMRGDLQV